jgi:hypothetical protein
MLIQQGVGMSNLSAIEPIDKPKVVAQPLLPGP